MTATASARAGWSSTPLITQTQPELAPGLSVRRVDELCVRAPKSLPVDASVLAVRREFDDSHVHMVLLVDEGMLRGTLVRTDLPRYARGPQAALPLSHLAGRTVDPDAQVGCVHRQLVRTGARRLAVTGPDLRLIGLLCLRCDGRSFCTNEGVAARALERTGGAA